jgi:hypothetical protein
MRSMLAAGILMLGLNGAAQEPEYPALVSGYFHRSQGATASLLEIESSTHRGDRLAIADLQPRALVVEILKHPAMDPKLRFASATADIGPEAAASAIMESDAAPGTEDDNADHGAQTAFDDVCNTLYASAQDNDLPIPFFANLLWQESRLRADDVSKKGAMGIAQFMPQTAVENGLEDPFDPMQAIPASARFLRELREQFGNLGFVAAAYNAGPHRVVAWLEHHTSLPRETRNYVVRVTGLSAEAWRKIPVDDAALSFERHLPCRALPAFVSIEQSEQAQAEQAKLAQEEAQLPTADRETAEEDNHARHLSRRAVRRTGRREAEHSPRVVRERRRSV